MATNPANPYTGQQGLGMGLGFDPRQRRQFSQALGAGDLSQWELAHPNQARRFENLAAGNRGTGAQQANARGAQAKNAGVGSTAGGGGAAAPPTIAKPPPRPPQMAPPATGNPATAGNKQPGGQGGQQGGPFQMQNWYGGNPLATASALASQQLQQQLGGIRSRYGGMGLGNSSREALSEGTAAAQSATGLGDVLASRGEEAYQSDANRALAANQQLANLGTGITGIGANEQNPPLANILMNLLSGLSGQNIFGGSQSSGSGGWWTS